MSHARDFVNIVRDQVAEDPVRLADVRARRDIVLAIAGPGWHNRSRTAERHCAGQRLSWSMMTQSSE